MLRGAADALIAALLAPPCAVCAGPIMHPLDGAVCERCWAALDPRPSQFSLDGLPQVHALGAYDGVLRDIVHVLKYDGRRSVAAPLAQLMRAQAAGVLAGADYVVPVPLHRRRRHARGFNQAEDLARGLGLPMLRVLRRVAWTPPQVGLPAGRRHSNVAHAFAVHVSPLTAVAQWCRAKAGGARGRPVDPRRALRGTTLVIVDDVATTGATLEACARVLRRAGAAEIRAVTAARVAIGRQ